MASIVGSGRAHRWRRARLDPCHYEMRYAWPAEKGARMNFRLTYRGQVRSRQQANVTHVHEIRRALHPQLKRLWDHEPLAGYAEYLHFPQNAARCGILEEIGGKTFAPLVTKQLDLVASVDVLFLRNQAPGQLLYEGGDLDNRVKTLLDALRRPSTAEVQQIGGAFDDSEQPFFCLLQDDALVTRLSVEADRFLEESEQHELLAIIQVHTRAVRHTWANIGIG